MSLPPLDAAARFALAQRTAPAICRGLTNEQKQALGQQIARLVGVHPGPRGADGGIDGVVDLPGGGIAHFSSKLSARELPEEQAKLLYADLRRHEARISVCVAGVGYVASFARWLDRMPDMAGVRFHRLTLADVMAESAAFGAAQADLPSLARLTEIDWYARFRQ